MINFIAGLCLGSSLILLIWILWIFITEPELYSITTNLGFKVNLSPLTSYLQKRDFDKWDWELIWLWVEKRGLNPILIFNCLKNIEITLIDQANMPAQLNDETGEHYRVFGVTYFRSKIIYICTLGLGFRKKLISEQVEALYKHEVSHIIGGFVDKLWLMKDSHPVFKDLGIKYTE